ncbi:MAG: hypothetical protein OXG37_12935 [Actinomycetia bacterium]|nr:hypothetical protein [Actinomycetes bacterium]
MKFKRHGEVVGISQGGARAWWVEETGSQGKAYCVEAAAGEFIRIAADSFENKGKNGFRMEFFREGEAVGVIYAVPAHADWWVGNDLPTRSAAGG